MDFIIDWLSFTLPTKEEPRSASKLYSDARRRLKEIGSEAEQTFFDGQGYDPCGGRSPYRIAIARDDGGSRIFGSSHTETVLYELSGRGCVALRDQQKARTVLGGVVDRLTRIDFAIDIVGDSRPVDFANNRDHDRFRSVSFIRSETGETVYIGSPKSDRFLRVYRYNPPHPRSDRTRCEFVFKRKLARAAALDYLSFDSTPHFVARLGNTYGLNHPGWEPGSSTSEKIHSPAVERKNQDAVAWFYRQVAPAARRLMDSGDLDMTDWLEFVYNGESEAART